MTQKDTRVIEDAQVTRVAGDFGVFGEVGQI